MSMANSTSFSTILSSAADEDDRPRFAVIRLKTESNLLGLFQLLLSNGFGEVAFVKNLNDCNFGGNKSMENGSSSPSKGASSLLTTITNGGMNYNNNNNEESSTAAKNANEQSNGQQSSSSSYGTKRKFSDRAANMLESSIQKLLDAKRRCSEKAHDKSKTDNTKSNQTRQSLNNFYTNGPIASLLRETFTDQDQQQTFSAKLPLSTFTCPLAPPSSAVSSNNTTMTTMGSSTKSKNQSSMDFERLIITDRSEADRSAIEILTKQSVNPSATASIGATRPIVQRQSQNQAKSSSASSSDRSAQPSSSQPTTAASSPPVTAIASLSGLFVECNLCHSKIMATRFSNLTNHVRRHAATKQFQCVHCDYAHNEIAKVRLHMTNNHSDKKSRPMNNITAEMQDEWRKLMRECFPERSKRQKPPRPIPPRDETDQQQQRQIPTGGHGLPTMVTTTTAGGTQSVVLTGARDADGRTIILGQQQKTTTKCEPNDFDGGSTSSALAAFSALEEEEEDDDVYREQVDDDQALRFARCEHCYVYVDASMKEHHVRTCHVEHLPASIVFSCSICELEDEDRPTIEIHVRAEHSDEMEDESDLDMIVRRMESDLSRVIDQYFPPHGLEYAGDNLDEIRRMAEEEEGDQQGDGDNSNEDNASNDGLGGEFKYQQPTNDQAMMDAAGNDGNGDHNDRSIEPVRRSTSRVSTRMSTRSQQSTSMSMEVGDDQSPDRSIKTLSLKSKN